MAFTWMSCILCNTSLKNIDQLFMQCPLLGIDVTNQMDIQTWMLYWLSASNVLAQQLFSVSFG